MLYDLVFRDGPMKGDKSFNTLALEIGDTVFIRIDNQKDPYGNVVGYKAVERAQKSLFMEQYHE